MDRYKVEGSTILFEKKRHAMQAANAGDVIQSVRVTKGSVTIISEWRKPKTPGYSYNALTSSKYRNVIALAGNDAE